MHAPLSPPPDSGSVCDSCLVENCASRGSPPEDSCDFTPHGMVFTSLGVFIFPLFFAAFTSAICGNMWNNSGFAQLMGGILGFFLGFLLVKIVYFIFNRK
ncbi:MAG: hypothetical protein Q4C96_06890 [Planctomycetia bacterium]|nr:hypothetical protein [Planctomycetia bacterium]